MLVDIFFELFWVFWVCKFFGGRVLLAGASLAEGGEARQRAGERGSAGQGRSGQVRAGQGRKGANPLEKDEGI